jgi:hypothetical protein
MLVGRRLVSGGGGSSANAGGGIDGVHAASSTRLGKAYVAVKTVVLGETD